MRLCLSRQAGLAVTLAALAALTACETRRTGPPVRESAGGEVGATPDSSSAVRGATGLDTATGVDTTQTRPHTPGGDTAGASAAGAGAGASPRSATDAHIFAMFDNANSTLATAAGIAAEKASSAPVREFARGVIADHGPLVNQSRTLSQQLDIAPQASADSALIQAEQRLLDTLRVAPRGAAFDTLYMREQVRLGRLLVPVLRTAEQSAGASELKALLQHALPVFESRLRQAERFQGDHATS